MQQYQTVTAVQKDIQQVREQGKTIGFVPTMGALHQGHLSLIHTAGQKSDITIVSIFVNPAQFNDQDDYKKYPRTLESDIEQLKQTKVDMLFTPDETEIYPDDKLPNFDFGTLEKVMEGKHRPGHFSGVAQVVKRLFDIIKPDVAVFGEKDFQQLAIIRQLVKIQNYNISIIGAPIIREADGLAMSSRNQRLNIEERKKAAFIHQILKASKSKIQYMTVREVEQWVNQSINQVDLLKTEYFEIVNTETLQPISNWQDNCDKIGCIAVYCGNIRLIDNIKYSF